MTNDPRFQYVNGKQVGLNWEHPSLGELPNPTRDVQETPIHQQVSW